MPVETVNQRESEDIKVPSDPKQKRVQMGKDLVKTFEQYVKVNKLMSKASKNQCLVLVDPENSSVTETFTKKDLSRAEDLIKRNMRLLASAKSTRAPVTIVPESFKGLYAVVVISPVLKKFIECIGKYPVDPNNPNGEKLGDYLKLAKEGFLMRNMLPNILNMYFDDHIVVVDGNKEIEITKEFEEIFDNKALRPFYYYDGVDDDEKPIKRLVTKDVKNPKTTLESVISSSKSGKLERIQGPAIHCLNYKTRNFLEKEGDTKNIKKISDDAVKAQALEEYYKVKEVRELYKEYNKSRQE